jgi:hypothetical protein
MIKQQDNLKVKHYHTKHSSGSNGEHADCLIKKLRVSLVSSTVSAAEQTPRPDKMAGTIEGVEAGSAKSGVVGMCEVEASKPKNSLLSLMVHFIDCFGLLLRSTPFASVIDI